MNFCAFCGAGMMHATTETCSSVCKALLSQRRGSTRRIGGLGGVEAPSAARRAELARQSDYSQEFERDIVWAARFERKLHRLSWWQRLVDWLVKGLGE